MQVILKVQGATTRQVRDIAAAMSKSRESLASYADWRPRVNCEGPECWGLETDPIPLAVARFVLGEVRGTGTD
jgi:hypothetical protein